MKLGELIERLEEVREEYGEAADGFVVLFAHQPRYPLQCGIEGPVVLRDDDDGDPEEPKADPVVYLAESGMYERNSLGKEFSPYAPRAAWDE